ncbi:MAG TPA: hypothetical protein VFA56_03145 [Gaiellaceae bacterium]|nr:hypothetical protein [Gaiellaceae bacterium]
MRILTLAVAGALAALLPAAALAHGDSADYVSTIDRVSPTVAGLTVRVVERDEGLRLVNKTGSTITIPGYEGEPYLRLLPSGVVEVNKHSPARYLNADRYAKSPIPSSANAKAAPAWVTIGHNGIARWHDHRIHWMSKTVPSKLRGRTTKSKVFDWSVPLEVGAKRVVVSGTLYWAPDEVAASGGGTPIGAILGGVGGGIAVLALAAFAFARRRSSHDGDAAPKAEKTQKAEKKADEAESW